MTQSSTFIILVLLLLLSLSHTVNSAASMTFNISTLVGIDGTSLDGVSSVSSMIKRPTSVSVLPNGDLIVADSGHTTIRRIFQSNGTITTIGGVGFPTLVSSGDDSSIPYSSTFMSIKGITSSKYQVLICDSFSIRNLSVNSGFISTSVGSTNVKSVQAFFNPVNVAVSPLDGSVYFTTFRYVYKLLSNGSAFGGNQVDPSYFTDYEFSGPFNASSGYSGDGGLATNAKLSYPLSPSGDSLYIADFYNDCIRKVSLSTGIITTFAGINDIYNSSLTSALTPISQPKGLSFSSSTGDLYITEGGRARVRKLTLSTGLISTIAGIGIHVGVPIQFSNLIATKTSLLYPTSVSVSPVTSEVFNTESGANLIRRIFVNGSTTVHAGYGTGYYSSVSENISLTNFNPNSVLVTSSNDILFADTSNHVIRKISNSGVVSVIAGTECVAGFSGDGGLATSSQLNSPVGLTLSKNGSFIYIADSGNHRIRMISPNGIITTIAGTGVAGLSGDGALAINAQFYYPQGLAVSSYGLFVADTKNNRIRLITNDGIVNSVAGSQGFNGDGKLATSAGIIPNFLAITSSGDVLFSDSDNHNIRKIIGGNGIISTVSGNGNSGLGSVDGSIANTSLVNNVSGIVVNSNNEIIYADSSNHCIRKILTNGTVVTIVGQPGVAGYSGDNGLAVKALLNSPLGVAVSSSGDLYFSDSQNYVIRMVNGSTGIIKTIAGNGVFGISNDGYPALSVSLTIPGGITFRESTKTIYFSDTLTRRVRSISPNGQINDYAGSGGSGSQATGYAIYSKISTTGGISFYGTDGYFVETANHAVRRVFANGTLIVHAGTLTNPGFAGDGGLAINALFNNPTGLVINQNTGEMYIADRGNFRIRKIDVNGYISTVAGNGLAPSSFNGDQSQSTNALISSPYSIAVSSNDQVVFSDTGNNRVRQLTVTAYVCFGILSTDSYVCNYGNGTCVGFNTCSCNSSYEGSTCSVKKKIPIPVQSSTPHTDSSSNIVLSGVDSCLNSNLFTFILLIVLLIIK